MKIRSIFSTILSAAVATAVLSVPRESSSQDYRYSKSRKNNENSQNNSSSQSNDSKEHHSHSDRSSYRSNNNNNQSSQVFTTKNIQNFATHLKNEIEKKADYQSQESANRYQSRDSVYQNQSKEPEYSRYQPKEKVNIPTKNWNQSQNYRPVEKTPVEKKPVTPYQPSGNKTADVNNMVSILKGKSLTVKPGVVSNNPKTETPKVVDRVVPVNPNALPKGMGTYSYMKKGKTPAEGLADGSEGGTATLYMKKGKDHAEGEADPSNPVVVRIKDGRPLAESDYNHEHTHGNSGNYGGGSHNLANNGNNYGGGYPAATNPSLAYRVDSSSQLATNSVKFQRGSTELADAASYYYLQNLAEALRDPSLSGDRFVVEGHASAEGSTTANLILSQQRANAIYDFLIAQGIPTERLLAVGHGEFHARYADTDPEYLRAQDRQVIVFKLAE